MSEGRNGDSHGSGNGKKPQAAGAPGAPPRAEDKNPKKPRAGDLGRALRSVYDDTLRENVPDDFLDLLGKLS